MLRKAWADLAKDVEDAKRLENLVQGRADAASTNEVTARLKTITRGLQSAHEASLAQQTREDLSDETILGLRRYTQGLPLKPFEMALDLVPYLVNLVSLADALPLCGSSLPFDLKKIAIRCRHATYFAPRRFTAVQLAFDQPRSRVLIFHTGRIVGTGSNGPMAAKLAVARALKTIAKDARLNIGVRRFAVINQVSPVSPVSPPLPRKDSVTQSTGRPRFHNQRTAHGAHGALTPVCVRVRPCAQVGAVALGARLDCDKFADVHSSTAHYDPKSFVGLAWRPQGEALCAEVYSTGKANLPGSRRERQLLRSFARMAPEMLRFTTNPELADRFDESLVKYHRPREHTRQAPRATARAHEAERQSKVAKKRSLWEDDDYEIDSSNIPVVDGFDDDDTDAFDSVFSNF